MNPWPVVVADLKALRWIAVVVPLFVALAVAIGVAVSAQETALRRASAQAADDFDLVIGAPGSQTQLVLTTVYLQPAALPLIDGAIINALAADARVKAVAPIAFGDVVRGYPVVGTTAAFVSRFGRVSPIEGRMFEREGEAVVGAGVDLHIGDEVTPSHAVAGHRHEPGHQSEHETEHRHEGAHYKVVGRLPRFGSPWDRAILVPIESVWEVHGLGNGHAREDAPLGAPFDAEKIPGVPAIVVEPVSIADAYALRGQYRQGGTVALFPAEVLVSLYRAIGDVRDLLVVGAVLNDVLVFAVTIVLLLALAGLRRRRYAVLRALGASRAYVLTTVWLGATLILLAGCLAGLGFGALASDLVGRVVEHRTGLSVAAGVGMTEILNTMALVLVGGAMALVPAYATLRVPVDEALR